MPCLELSIGTFTGIRFHRGITIREFAQKEAKPRGNRITSICPLWSNLVPSVLARAQSGKRRERGINSYQAFTMALTWYVATQIPGTHGEVMPKGGVTL